jgi:hypothetical protein
MLNFSYWISSYEVKQAIFAEIGISFNASNIFLHWGDFQLWQRGIPARHLKFIIHKYYLFFEALYPKLYT